MWNLYAYCGNNPINRIDPDGRESYDRLNKAEKKLVINNPFIAYCIGQLADRSFEQTNKRFNSIKSLHNVKGDAFRHALWNALMTSNFDEKIAKKFADAHEKTSNQPSIEKEMDLYNNEIGRKIGKENSKATGIPPFYL